ncbi:MAG: hypothetical protein A2W26_09115 [Acidobacteria bacterium RBG_16_64_8]|nr:MAG: hypothetical protein A2W26_09115 [Acidobacteria bacterium RBG_16_64_8]
MRFSEARISYLAHRIVEVFKDENLAEIDNERLVLNDIKHVLGEAHEREAQIDTVVRRKIASLSRQVPVGSREWDVLYRKYVDEERRRQKT